METIAGFVARTRGPVVPFVDDWYPWAYAHHYLRTEIENMPLELGRVLSSVRVDDAVSLIHAWCAATGEDVDDAVHLLADAYLERWGLAPPEDAYPTTFDEDELGLDDDLAQAYADEEVYGGAQDAYATGDGEQYAEECEDATQLLPVVYGEGGADQPQSSADVEAAVEAAAAEALAAAKADHSGKADRNSKGDRNSKADRNSKGDRTGRTPRPVKAADRALVAEQILAADQALVAEHPLVAGRPLAARR